MIPLALIPLLVYTSRRDVMGALVNRAGTIAIGVLITTGIVYNTAATMIPASWEDLTKPEAQGQIAMPSPLPVPTIR